METAEAAELIRSAVPGGDGTWADLGAGGGTFTRALASLLGPGARIHAIDRDPAAVRELARQSGDATFGDTRIDPHLSDFLGLRSLPVFAGARLDGVLMANSLHFVAEPAGLLADVAHLVRPGGRLVIVEYDDRPASRWVPYPVPFERLRRLLPTAGFDEPTLAGERPSLYGGRVYAASALRRGTERLRDGSRAREL